MQTKSYQEKKTALPAESGENHARTETIAATSVAEDCARALRARENYVFWCVVAGLRLMEDFKKSLQCHGGTNIIVDALDKEKPDATIGGWLSATCPNIPRRTAHRWMTAARRTVAHLLEIRYDKKLHIPLEVVLDGKPCLISKVLKAPDAECTDNMATFKDTFQIFLKNKTLTEAAEGMIERDGAAQLENADNGRKGGDPLGDRKNTPFHLARAYDKVSYHWGRWEKMDATQRKDILALTDGLIFGESCKIENSLGREIEKSYQPPPIDVIRHLQSRCRAFLAKHAKNCAE